ncbi:MAG TPA: transglutaminase family protein [Kaistia sp.]|jgi:transglutaminase-like putative cysteine protease|nr:transglutaminase family protein [Kaistia sp.]
MHIRIGFDIAFECAQPTPMLMMLRAHPSLGSRLVQQDYLVSDPVVAIDTYIDGFGNLASRTVLPAGRTRIWTEGVVYNDGEPDPVVPDARILPVQELPEECLVYLLGSRYCETDHLGFVAWPLFGHLPENWARVQAIVDYVHNHLTFSYPLARPTRTALEAHNERFAVCRDFAHLAIALCRAMNIPARYCTGYLGDIGVPYDPAPMDFSAWFEAYIGDRWYTFDARHNKPRIGRIVMARGRDATDVALTNAFGNAMLVNFTVHTEEIVWPRAGEQAGAQANPNPGQQDPASLGAVHPVAGVA